MPVSALISFDLGEFNAHTSCPHFSASTLLCPPKKLLLCLMTNNFLPKQHIAMNIIAALDANCGIGRLNALPWHLPEEYAHFVHVSTRTMDPRKRNAVLMGRKSWESIPKRFRPLKGRLNIVLSRTMEPQISDQLIVAEQLDEVLAILRDEPFNGTVETIWNAGGHDIYALGLQHPSLHKLVLTRLDKAFDCDVHFPSVDWTQFERNNDFGDSEEKHEERGVTWYVTSYTRKKAEGAMEEQAHDKGEESSEETRGTKMHDKEKENER